MQRLVLFMSLSALMLFFATVFAQERPRPPKPPEYTSETEVAKDATLKRDFDIQGEYLGKFLDWTIGLHLIAQGDGKFNFVVFVDGLPGDAWFRDGIRAFGKGELNDKGELEFRLEQIDDGGGRRAATTNDIDALQGTVTFKDGKATFVIAGTRHGFTKQNRESPTLGLKAPEGAVVLFADGKASDLFERAEVNQEVGTLWAEARTKPFEKRPYTMHIEFMLSYMPTARGQARSNSGVYIDEAYECQILDSFGLEGENNECGGFYTMAKPIVNMCFPPLRWQTYDIDFVPAKFDADGKKTADAMISVKHNGRLIQNEIRPAKETPGGKKETPDARGVYLQGHGNRVQYKNIWIKYAD